MRHSSLFIVPMAATLLLSGCIEPDLHLAAESDNRLHVELVTDTSLHTPYTVYPAPTYYELRHFVSEGDSSEHTVEANTIYSSSVDRYVSAGRHRLLAWSDIDSPDGTQVLTVNEDGGHATASTTIDPDGISMKDSLAADSMGMPTIRHAPEMFYGGQADGIDIEEAGIVYDCDADSERVTSAVVTLRPLVYCLRMEIIIVGNDGHITGTPGQTVLTSMAKSVDIATGRTLHEPCGVFFTSKMNHNATANAAQSTVNGAQTNGNDTIIGTFTTFGLCDMEPYSPSNTNLFGNGRSDLRNYLFFTLSFNNGAEKTYRTDVTDIVRHELHGGLIRLTINAADIPTPDKKNDGGSSGGAGFNPTVDDYDDVVHEFDM